MQPANVPSEPGQGRDHGLYKVIIEIANRIRDDLLLFVIGIAVVLVALAGPAALRGASADVRFFAIIIAVLAFVVIVGTFTLKLVGVSRRQVHQQAEIDAIRLALRGILMKHEFGPLKRLAEPGKATITKESNLGKYLHRLDGLNFIQPNPGHGLHEIDQIKDGTQFDLKDYL